MVDDFFSLIKVDDKIKLYHGKHLQLLRKFCEQLIVMAKKRKGKWKSNYENLLFNLQFLKLLKKIACHGRRMHLDNNISFVRKINVTFFASFMS